MPTDFRSLGPIDHWVRPIGSANFSHLGTATTSPSIREGDAYLPLVNDIGGRSNPMQLVRDRRKITVVTTLNRFSWQTYNFLKSLRPIGGVNSLTFAEEMTDHGLPVLGVSSFELLLTFSFGTLSGADTPTGRIYFGTVLKDWQEDSVGTRVVDLTLVFESYGLFNPTTRSFLRYTEDLSTVGPLVAG